MNDENSTTKKDEKPDEENSSVASDRSRDEGQDDTRGRAEKPVEAMGTTPEGLKETPALEEDETSLVNTENS